MRILAIVVNLAQIALILAIYFANGLSLGDALVLAMFGLLIFAFVNLLVLLFYTTASEREQPLAGREKPVLIKRRDVRVVYAPGPGPDLAVGRRTYAVLDLAENGLRFNLGRQARFRKHVRGRITLLCGKCISFKGSLLRRQGAEAALGFSHPVDIPLLLEEQKVQAAQAVPATCAFSDPYPAP